MTMTDRAGYTLIAAWDARDRSWFDGRRLARTEWLRNHDVPVDITYRAEFCPDGPSVKIWTYVLDAKGRMNWGPEHSPYHDHDHDLCRPAVELPRTIPLGELPPESLLEG